MLRWWRVLEPSHSPDVGRATQGSGYYHRTTNACWGIRSWKWRAGKLWYRRHLQLIPGMFAFLRVKPHITSRKQLFWNVLTVVGRRLSVQETRSWTPRQCDKREQMCIVNQHGGWSCCRVGFPFAWLVQARRWAPTGKWSPKWLSNDPGRQMIPGLPGKLL